MVLCLGQSQFLHTITAGLPHQLSAQPPELVLAVQQRNDILYGIPHLHGDQLLRRRTGGGGHDEVEGVDDLADGQDGAVTGVQIDGVDHNKKFGEDGDSHVFWRLKTIINQICIYENKKVIAEELRSEIKN